MKTTNNSHYKKNKHSTNSANTSKSKHHYFILFLLVLFIISIGIYFFIPNSLLKKENNENTVNTFNELQLSDVHKFENNTNLFCENFSINIENNLTKVKGTIINNSSILHKELNCLFTLFDDSNNVINSFRISISLLEANASLAFSSVCAVDLSQVQSYTVKLID